MADFFCRFLDFRSPTINYKKMPSILPSNHYYTSSLHSRSSRITITRKTPHHLTLLCASSSQFDVISTHEHSDGSLLFRFGDPNEVAKNVKTVESKTVEKDIEGEDEDESLLEKKADGEVTVEVADVTNSILSSSSNIAVVEGENVSSENLLQTSSDTSNSNIAVVEGESESSETLLQTSSDTSNSNIAVVEGESKSSENLLQTSSDTSNSIIAVVEGESKSSENLLQTSSDTSNSNIAVVEGESKSSENLLQTSSDTSNSNIAVVEGESKSSENLLQTSSDTSNSNIAVVEGESKSSENLLQTSSDTSNSNIAVVEGESKSSENLLQTSSDTSNSIIAVVEGESESSETLLQSSSDTELPVLTSSGESEDVLAPNVEATEEVLNEDYEDSSRVESSILDEGYIAKVENNTTTPEFLEKENAEDPSITEPTEVSPISEYKNVETEMQIETGEDGSESFGSKEIEEHNLQAEMQYVAIGEGSKSDIEALEMQSVAIGEGSESDIEALEMQNVAIGEGSKSDIEALEMQNVAIGEGSKSDIEALEMQNVAIGEGSKSDIEALEVQNVAIGEGSKSDIEALENVAIGEGSESDIDALEMQNAAAGEGSKSDIEAPEMQNVAIGEGSKSDIESLEMQKVAIGEGSKSDIETLEMQNVAIGEGSKSEIEALENVAIGEGRESDIEALENVAIGEGRESDIEALEMQNVAIGEGSKSDIEALEMQSVMSNGNASDAEAKSLTMEDETSGAGSGMPDAAVEFLSEKDTIQSINVPPQLVADSVLEEETSIGTLEESSEDDGSGNQKVGGYLVEASAHEATMTEYTPISKSDMNDIEDLEIQNVMSNGNATDTSDAEAMPPTMEDSASGAGGEEVTIQLMNMPQLEADSVLDVETGVVSINESREDDGTKDLKVGGELVEASVHEATVTESTSTSHETLKTELVLSSGAALLLHPSKALTGGEDAYFISGETWLGIADGIGLWSLQGTNPGVYAQQLMKNCERLISVKNGDSINNPVELLNLSVAETDSPGSSTVLITQFDGQALHVANVGDSGFIVLRNGAIHKRSSPMNHAFYFPMQIGRGDDPSSLAELYRVDLEEDDVIITATDGLLDNLYDQEIALIVMKSLAADKKLQEIAEKLALKAQEIGSSASVRTPFADNAGAAGFAGYTGGKLDDVAVIVSLVQRR